MIRALDLKSLFLLIYECVCVCLCVCVWGGGGGATPAEQKNESILPNSDFSRILSKLKSRSHDTRFCTSQRRLGCSLKSEFDVVENGALVIEIRTTMLCCGNVAFDRVCGQ